jgi:hypothetical protein
MPVKTPKTESRSMFRPSLLRSESSREYAAHRSRIFRDFCPSGYLGEILVDEIAKSSWEVLRYHRFGADIINSAFIPALQNVLALTSNFYGIDTNALAQRYFTDGKQEILDRLAAAGSDEIATEAEAFRLRASCLADHEKLLSAAEKRCIRAIRAFQDYRAGLATPIHRNHANTRKTTELLTIDDDGRGAD